MSPDFPDHFDLMRQDLSESTWGNAVCKRRECSRRNPNSCPLFPKRWEEGSDLMHLQALARKLFLTSKVTCKELKLSCCCLRTESCFNLEHQVCSSGFEGEGRVFLGVV